MSTYSNRLQPALQNLLQRVVWFFPPRSSCTTHISAEVQRITLNASCMTISGGRTEQLDIPSRQTIIQPVVAESLAVFSESTQNCVVHLWVVDCALFLLMWEKRHSCFSVYPLRFNVSISIPCCCMILLLTTIRTSSPPVLIYLSF